MVIEFEGEFVNSQGCAGEVDTVRKGERLSRNRPDRVKCVATKFVVFRES